MVSPSSNILKNKLLAGLSNADLALLQPHLEPVELEVRKVLESPNKPIKHSYFIERGLASIVAGNSHKRLEAFIQVAGEGSRIPADKLREAMWQSRSLEKAFLKFAHSFLNQTANSAFSNGTATLEERLARWLLMANDRLDGDEIPLTHEFLSLMLGVRRAGVTVALNYLESRGIIRCRGARSSSLIGRVSRQVPTALITTLRTADQHRSQTYCVWC
jgi:CRP-like cAMP-binding protein